MKIHHVYEIHRTVEEGKPDAFTIRFRLKDGRRAGRLVEPGETIDQALQVVIKGEAELEKLSAQLCVESPPIMRGETK